MKVAATKKYLRKIISFFNKNGKYLDEEKYKIKDYKFISIVHERPNGYVHGTYHICDKAINEKLAVIYWDSRPDSATRGNYLIGFYVSYFSITFDIYDEIYDFIHNGISELKESQS